MLRKTLPSLMAIVITFVLSNAAAAPFQLPAAENDGNITKILRGLLGDKNTSAPKNNPPGNLPNHPSNIATIGLSKLPHEAQTTYRLIHQGGPFPYEKDGSTFGNREKILPAAPRGYYREYTVPTPGQRTRGARRIVCGGQQATRPQSCYYSGDHYASFQHIQP